MGSNVVDWKGRCADPADQDALLAYLGRLAQAHRRYCLDGPGPRPQVSRILAKQRGEDEIKTPLLTVYDEEISGRIAVCSDVLHDRNRETLTAVLGAAGIESQCLNPPLGRNFTFSLPRLHLKGLDFQLYDPRGLYPGEDRVSCVFLRSDDLPFLDGLIAKVSGPQACARIAVQHLKGTEWYVECPFVHVRYYLEDWLDLVLSWIKRFHVPDLHYFHGLPLAGFTRHSYDFDHAIADHGRDAVCEAVFRDIVRAFEAEADNWAAATDDR